MPYFDPEPKRRREDFYDMDEELNSFISSVKRDKLVVVTGLRRYGKTSLILTGLNTAGVRYVVIDCRLLPRGMVSLRDIASLIEAELSSKSWVRHLIKGLESVSVAGVRVRFREVSMTAIAEVLSRLGGAVLVIDEAQELRRSRHRFDALLAHLYDYSDTRIVVSGSQVGMLYRFLRVNDPEAPLYGRPFTEIRVKRLSRDEGRDFLKAGFRQEGVDVGEDVIEEALNTFDGVIGWLTYFGYMYTRAGKRSVREVLEVATAMALKELENSLSLYSMARARYVHVLKTIASLGGASWSEIKRAVEARLGRVPDTALANILRNLLDLSIIAKAGNKYVIPDKVLEHAVKTRLR